MKNNKVVLLNLFGLVFIVLAFVVHWMFIALAVIFSGWGLKVLLKDDNS
ncbi:MAG: hypothetical protein IIA87_05565 [Nanoarchaeota archaeon]|nr:hypothetical protein [Nanoarchaeota archaeon]